jgi:hypothetical protein
MSARFTERVSGWMDRAGGAVPALVLCTVPEQAAALRELRRVVRAPVVSCDSSSTWSPSSLVDCGECSNWSTLRRFPTTGPSSPAAPHTLGQARSPTTGCRR